MELAECYRLLELAPNAGVEDIKASYRRLARRYHPDVNPDNREQAHRKFIQVTEAYKYLLERASKRQPRREEPRVTVKKQPKPDQETKSSSSSEFDQKVKWDSYQQLQDLLKQGKFSRATTLGESLAKRFPNDSEVRQWQAIAYQRRGRQLINEGKFDLARKFLKKALSTDPHNRSLWYEIDRDFQRIDPLL
ncbi:MAG: J domain-containing protein [Halothece sp.]